MYIGQKQLENIESLSNENIIILYGPRQVGKTTMSKELLRKEGLSVDKRYSAYNGLWGEITKLSIIKI